MMSRTNLDATTLALDLRDKAGDGSIEWVNQPIQADVLLDIADMLDENDRMREELAKWERLTAGIDLPEYPVTQFKPKDLERENARLRELVADMNACIEALCSMVENSPGCSMCPTNHDDEKPCAAADVYCRMRELKIDVK